MISNTDIRSVLKGQKFAWSCVRNLDCIGLDHYLKPEMILSADFSRTAERYWPEDVRIFSMEKERGVRENWNGAFFEKYITTNADQIRAQIDQIPDPFCIITYSPSRGMGKFVKTLDPRVKLVMPDSEIKLSLDDKFHLQRILQTLQMPVIEGYTAIARPGAYAEHKNKLGERFVMSMQFGASGSGTFFIPDEESYEKVCERGTDVEARFSSFVRGASININAAVMGKKVVVSYPSIQLVGLEECASRPEVYCGNDYGSIRLLPPELLHTAQEYVYRIGKWIADYGFKGMFGLDLLVDLENRKIYPVDLNPRFQNSTMILTHMQMLKDDTPLAILNIAYHLGLIPEEEIEEAFAPEPVMEVSQMILHNIHGLSRVQGNLEPGIYALNGNGLEKRKEGVSLLAGVGPDEFLVACAVPQHGLVTKPGASLLKIIVPRRVVDLETGQLLPWAKDMCRQVDAALGLEEVEAEAAATLI